MKTQILLLGGTGEARLIADGCQGMPGIEVVSSLAGRVARPKLPVGRVRVGGFGGIDGLESYLRHGEDGDQPVAAVVDATHPFAAKISAHAAQACERVGVPRLVVRRPGYAQPTGSQWVWVDHLADAAAIVGDLGRRVFLTTGRQGVANFADAAGCSFVLRCVDPPTEQLPPDCTVLLSRGPYDASAELALLRQHRIDVLVSKDSGGQLTTGKLTAAAHLGVPVVMVRRPPIPPSEVVATPAEALQWVRSRH